jgi:beta-galactosidase/beta-glucuronidase
MPLRYRSSHLILSCVLVSAVTAGEAQPRIHSATTPIPMQEERPILPDQLRGRNPAVYAMTGKWRFSLTHGQMRDGLFLRSADRFSASSARGDSIATKAFDGSADTQWCAKDGAFPQWVQVDLGTQAKVGGIDLTWEAADVWFNCKLEGSADGKSWTVLAEQAEAGNGPLKFTPAQARFLRLTLNKGKPGRWAVMREWITSIVGPDGTHPWEPRPTAEEQAKANDFARPDFDDSSWSDLDVPSNWEMAGYSVPTYGWCDDTVGLYRRWVEIPKRFDGAHVVWRFDGVYVGAEVFVNGKKAGYHESGYTAWEIDVTDLIRPGERNLVALRVSKDTFSSICDKGDFESMGGIFRETYLIAVPKTHVADIALRTGLDAQYRDADLEADVEVAGKPGATVAVTAKLATADGSPVPADGLTGSAVLGADGCGTAKLRAKVSAPKLWSAEKPNLYYLMVSIPGERVQQRFGFRSIEVRGAVLLWNGQPIKCTGVCRHDIWATLGTAMDEAAYRKEMALIKAANINSIRTSHYNQATRFMELAEEMGFYLLDEVPFCWVGDKGIKDPAFLPPLMQRLEETWGRDKNNPAVLAWSLGNENPTGSNQKVLMDRMMELDPVRLTFASQCGTWDYKRQRVNDQHYPGLQGIVNAGMTSKVPAFWSEQPHIFWQQESLDLDPGLADLWAKTLAKSWDVIWREPALLGAFIWEWQDQGVADKFPDHSREWEEATGLRFNNRKGIVDSFRNPKTEWWYVKTYYSPVVIAAKEIQPENGTCTVPLENRHRFTDLNELTCSWTALAEGKPITNGTLKVACPPCAQVLASVPAPKGLTALRLEFTHPDGRSIISAVLPVHGAPPPKAPAPLAKGTALTHTETAETDTISNDISSVVFDHATGQLRSWTVRGQQMIAGGPIMTFGESKRWDEKQGFIYSPKPPTSGKAKVTVAKRWDAVRVTTTNELRCGAKEQHRSYLVCDYDIQPDATIAVQWRLIWDTANVQAWDLGMKWLLPKTFASMSWSRGNTFAADYPPGHIGAPQGTCEEKDVAFRASKRDLNWLSVTDGSMALTVRPDGVPLVGRCRPEGGAIQLIISREVAGPKDFSGSYVSEHEIHLMKDVSYIGRFILQAGPVARTSP